MQTRIKQRPPRLVFTCSAIFIVSLLGSRPEKAIAEPLSPVRMEWNKVPIEVTLKVGVEQQIAFPAPVKVGAPASLKTKLRVQSVSDTIYLHASSAFDPTRLVVQTREGGHTYLLDVDASEAERPSPPLEIADRESRTLQTVTPASSTSALLSTTDPVALTRFAAQQLYAPVRLLKPVRGLVRVPVPTAPFPLVRGGEVSARPLIGWRSGERYVTAVKLTNTSKTAVELDPRELRGHWLTAAFQHHRLLPAGSEADSTVAYLVSARPFAVSL